MKINLNLEFDLSNPEELELFNQITTNIEAGLVVKKEPSISKVEEKPKRKRRTKAEIEADKKAAEEPAETPEAPKEEPAEDDHGITFAMVRAAASTASKASSEAKAATRKAMTEFKDKSNNPCTKLSLIQVKDYPAAKKAFEKIQTDYAEA